MKKYIFAVFIIVAIFISPVVALGDELTVTPTATPTTEENVTAVPVEYVTASPSIIDIVAQWIGLEQPTNTTVGVTIDGKLTAVIPQNSPLNGMKVHDSCLRAGYGSINWYNCERALP